MSRPFDFDRLKYFPLDGRLTYSRLNRPGKPPVVIQRDTYGKNLPVYNVYVYGNSSTDTWLHLDELTMRCVVLDLLK